MTNSQILHKARCIEERERVAKFALGQFFRVAFENHAGNTAYIDCFHGTDEVIPEEAHMIFRNALMDAKQKYIDWLTEEIGDGDTWKQPQNV